MVTVEANDEFLYLDLAFPTTKLHGRGMGDDGSDDVEGGLNGMEAAFQVRFLLFLTTTKHGTAVLLCCPVGAYQ